MGIGLEAKVQYLINKHGVEAVAEAIKNILARDFPDLSTGQAGVRPETQAWMEGRREALAAAAYKFGLIPHTVGQVKFEGRNN
jgi:hypothetical protein